MIFKCQASRTTLVYVGMRYQEEENISQNEAANMAQIRILRVRSKTLI